jgi:anti-sigma B factor antagonist
VAFGVASVAEVAAMVRTVAVEVFVPFTGRWVDGYDIAASTTVGGSTAYWVRRRSDGHLLPEALEAERVRPIESAGGIESAADDMGEAVQPDADAEAGLSIVVGTEGAASTVTVRGELVYEVCPAFEEVVKPLVHDGSTIAVDLSGVTFIDSSGLRALMTAQQAAMKGDGTLCVVALSDRVLSMLHRTGTFDVLTSAGADGRWN